MSGRIARPGGQLVAEAGADPLITPGVRDLYGAVLVEASAFARRRRLELIVEIGLIGLYFALRTIGANEPTLDVWLVVVAVVALASPTSGLVILAAIAPFNEGISITRDIGSKTVLAVALLIGVTVRVGMRWAVDPTARRRPTRAMLPVILAGGLIVGTGLGGGVIIDGELLRYTGECAGDLGHIIVDPKGRLCTCGARGCLEAMVNSAALSERAGGRAVRDIVKSGRQGDKLARKALAETGWWLGLGLASLSPVFAPDRIVVGGGIAAAGELLLESVRTSYRTHARPEFREKVQVVGSSFDGWEGMVGAASLFLDPLS